MWKIEEKRWDDEFIFFFVHSFLFSIKNNERLRNSFHYHKQILNDSKNYCIQNWRTECHNNHKFTFFFFFPFSSLIFIVCIFKKRNVETKIYFNFFFLHESVGMNNDVYKTMKTSSSSHTSRFLSANILLPKHKMVKTNTMNTTNNTVKCSASFYISAILFD